MYLSNLTVSKIFATSVPWTFAVPWRHRCTHKPVWGSRRRRPSGLYGISLTIIKYMNELSLIRHPSVQRHLPTLYLFDVSKPVITSISSIFCFTNMPFTVIMSSEIVAPDTTGTFGTFTLVGVVTFYSPVIDHKNKNHTWIAKASPGPTPAGTTTLTVPLGPSTAIIWPGFTPCRSHAKMKITLCRWHACGALRFV